MSDCIFCEIAAGRAKAEVVLETPDAIAFLDRYPAARGHVVVIPKVHAATLAELGDDAVPGLFLAVKTVMRKVSGALRPVAMNVGWNHGKDAGQHVFHLHVHVLPRHHPGGRGVQMLGEGTGRVSFDELREAIRKA
ncbi:MAG TPA: HIT domain-containing protein [Anaeromyxobacter sp.]